MPSTRSRGGPGQVRTGPGAAEQGARATGGSSGAAEGEPNSLPIGNPDKDDPTGEKFVRDNWWWIREIVPPYIKSAYEAIFAAEVAANNIQQATLPFLDIVLAMVRKAADLGAGVDAGVDSSKR